MKAHILQHVSFEGLGSISQWLQARNAKISYTRFFKCDGLPEPESLDLVIVMGGPMSANDEDKFPWLITEKQFIRDAIARSIPVLGICLGAQLIANAMGSKVFRNPVKEIGWFSVQSTPTPEGFCAMPKECLAFHWHGETFDLPSNAVRLARSIACENQAFQIKRNVVGLQFHLETTADSASALLENCRDEIVPGPYIQSELEIRSIPESSYMAINAVMNNVLSYITEARL
jgi:GMP synthase-like glutamine amidotransferase